MKKNEIHNVEGIKVAWCCNHKEWEPISEFGSNKIRNSGLAAICKASKAIQNAQENNKRNLDHWIVYELSNGRIGQTNRPYFRMSEHKHQRRIESIKDYEVIAITHSKAEAHILESLYQSLSPNYDKPDWGNQVKEL